MNGAIGSSIPSVMVYWAKDKFMKKSIGIIGIVLCSLTVGISAHADFKSLKVVGRGIQNKETQESLQLACVGRRVQTDSLERECNVLNFLLTDASGVPHLVGKPFFVSDESDVSVRRQLKSQMQSRRLQGSPSSSDIFAYSRGLFQKDGGGLRIFAILFSGAALAGGIPLWGLAIGPGVLLLTDMIGLPFAIIDAVKYGDKALSVTSAQALRDRAMNQWQVHPKKVRAKRFNRVLRVLSEEGLDEGTLESLEEQVRESEEDRRIEDEERKAQLRSAFPPYSGDTSSECFVDSVEIKYESSAEGLALRLIGQEYVEEHPSSKKFTDPMLEKIGLMRYLRTRGFLFDDAAVLLGNGSRGSKIKFQIRDHKNRGSLTRFVMETSLHRGGEELGRSIMNRTTSRDYGNDAKKMASKLTHETLQFYEAGCDVLTSRSTHRRRATFF